MKCQFCSCTDSKVIDSRPTDDGNSIRRRRECIGCGRRFTTYEKVEKEATPKLSAEQFFKLVADTATLIYKTKHNENMKE